MAAQRRLFAGAILAAGLIIGLDQPVFSAEETPRPSASLTSKERLGKKSSDEQRVDDCGVPMPERTKPRPDDCARDRRTLAK